MANSRAHSTGAHCVYCLASVYGCQRDGGRFNKPERLDVREDQCGQELASHVEIGPGLIDKKYSRLQNWLPTLHAFGNKISPCRARGPEFR